MPAQPKRKPKSAKASKRVSVTPVRAKKILPELTDVHTGRAASSLPRRHSPPQTTAAVSSSSGGASSAEHGPESHISERTRHGRDMHAGRSSLTPSTSGAARTATPPAQPSPASAPLTNQSQGKQPGRSEAHNLGTAGSIPAPATNYAGIIDATSNDLGALAGMGQKPDESQSKRRGSREMQMVVIGFALFWVALGLAAWIFMR